MARGRSGLGARVEQLLRAALGAVRDGGAGTLQAPAPTVPPRRPGHPRPSGPPTGYPGDHEGPVRVEYAPSPDGVADPGEVVWTWVPFEEDVTRGKDRPVLVVGRDGPWLLGLLLTSKDHDRDAADEARYGRRWMDLGPGPWDRTGRPSEVRLDRVVRLDPALVRREGGRLPRARFDEVARALGR